MFFLQKGYKIIIVRRNNMEDKNKIVDGEIIKESDEKIKKQENFFTSKVFLTIK